LIPNRASGFTTRSDIGPAREGPSAETVAAAQAARGEEIVENPDAYADPDDEKNIFAGTVYEQDDEEADRYVSVPLYRVEAAAGRKKELWEGRKERASSTKRDES